MYHRIRKNFVSDCERVKEDIVLFSLIIGKRIVLQEKYIYIGKL